MRATPKNREHRGSPPLHHRVARIPVRLARVRRGLPVSTGRVALTFDDGPDPTFTPAVLDILGEEGVSATFFLVGRRAEQHPALVRRIRRDGHVIGSHSWSHPDPSQQSLAGLVTEYRRGRRAVEAAAGTAVRLFRPPMGEIGPRSAAAAVLSGVEPWLWTRDPHDWLPGRTTEDILGDLEALRSGDVVLLHDGIERPVSEEVSDRSATVGAVRELIRRARAAGLGLVPLSTRR